MLLQSLVAAYEPHQEYTSSVTFMLRSELSPEIHEASLHACGAAKARVKRGGAGARVVSHSSSIDVETMMAHCRGCEWYGSPLGKTHTAS